MRCLAAATPFLFAAAVVGGWVPPTALPFRAPETEIAMLRVRGRTVTSLPVAVADSPLVRARGLAGRRLAAGYGLVLAYDPPRPVRLTFARTCQALDVAFVGSGGTVDAVHRAVRPGTPKPLPSPGPVRFVLELAEGEADRFGLIVGAAISVDRVRQDVRRDDAAPSPFEPCSR